MCERRCRDQEVEPDGCHREAAGHGRCGARFGLVGSGAAEWQECQEHSCSPDSAAVPGGVRRTVLPHEHDCTGRSPCSAGPGVNERSHPATGAAQRGSERVAESIGCAAHTDLFDLGGAGRQPTACPLLLAAPSRKSKDMLAAT